MVELVYWVNLSKQTRNNVLAFLTEVPQWGRF